MSNINLHLEQKSLIKTSLGSRLQLDGIYNNNLHALRCFQVENLTDFKLFVRFKSNLPGRIALQETNENLQDVTTLSTVNSVAFCTTNPTWLANYNQVFNYADHVTEFPLEPRQRRDLILTFLPAQTKSTESDVFDFKDVNGQLFFFAYKQEPKSEGASPDQTLTVKFRSKVCKSVIWSSAFEQGLSFDECVLGGTFFRDFTLWNRSEIEAWWSITVSNLSKHTTLLFSDYETNEPILIGQPIPLPIAAYSHKRVRVMFRPTVVGDFDWNIEVENLNDPGNTEEIRAHASVRKVAKEEVLITSTSVLDFGECLGGKWARQTFLVRNVTDHPLDIKLEAEEGSEVIWEVKMGDEGRRPLQAPRLNVDVVASSRPLTPMSADDDTSSVSSKSSFTESVGSPIIQVVPLSAASMKSSVHDLESYNDSPLTQSVISHQMERSKLLGTDAFDEDFLTTGGTGASGERDVTYLKVEDIVLRPGMERAIDICYRPESLPWTRDEKGGSLVRHQFRVFLSYGPSGAPLQQKERRTIQCKARVCTSYISVSPNELNFGDTDVGTLKSLPLTITNHSDLPANIELRFVSKILNAHQGELIIPPRQSIEVKIDNYPRKVNPDYRKQITVVNLSNRSNDQIVEVQSCNVDKQRVTFHSLFYRILTPGALSYLDFGTVVLNSAGVRVITIENVSNGPVTLDVSTTLPDELRIYSIDSTLPSSSPPLDKSLSETPKPSDIRQKRVEELGDKKSKDEPPKQATNASVRSLVLKSNSDLGQQPLPSYLDLATDPKTASPRRKIVSGSATSFVRSKNLEEPQPTSPLVRPAFFKKQSNVSLEPRSLTGPLDLPSSAALAESLVDGSKNYPEVSKDLDLVTRLALYEKIVGNTPHSFADLRSEENFVRTIVALRRDLVDAVNQTSIIPVTEITVPPLASARLAVVFSPLGDHRPQVQGKPRKQDARVLIRLSGLDRSIAIAHLKSKSLSNFDLESVDMAELLSLLDIPTRELLVQASICRSIADLTQRNINFGLLSKGDRRSKTVVIQNRSEVPLFYALRKSGSIASGDLILGDGRYGVIRGYGKREVEFEFEPSMAGLVQEKIVVENVLDRSNDQSLTVKAQVRKPANFFIDTLEVEFEPCVVNQPQAVYQRVVITNTSEKLRTIQVRIDPAEFEFPEGATADIDFRLVDGTDGGGTARRLTKEEEEKLEHYEQKLKIAIRKEQDDKIASLRSKIAKLRGIGEDQIALPTSAVDGPSLAASPVLPSRNLDSPVQDELRPPSPVKSKTHHSFVFPVAPGGQATVELSFRPTLADFKGKHGNFVFEGNLYVNEYRNTDSVKIVRFSCLVDVVPLTPTQPKLDSSLKDKPQSLCLEHSVIDLGKIEAGTVKQCFVNLLADTIINESDFSIVKEETDSRLLFTHGAISLNEHPVKYRMDAEAHLSLTDTGRQEMTAVFLDKHSGNKLSVVFKCYGLERRYLEFGVDALDWNLGECFVESGQRFAKIAPLTLKNVSTTRIIVTCTSNLAQQAMVLSDAKSEVPVGDMIMEAGQSMTVYLGIQSPSSSTILEPRQVVGGLRFQVRTLDGGEEVTLAQPSLKFTCLLGTSLISASPRQILLENVKEQGKIVPTSVTLTNLTPQMSFKVEIKSAYGFCRFRSDVLEGSGKEPQIVEFDVVCDRVGLLQDTLVFTNLRNSNDVAKVELSVFVNPGKLEVLDDDDLPGQIAFGNVFVTKADNDFHPISHDLSLRMLIISNVSDEVVNVVLDSDLPIHAGWHPDVTPPHKTSNGYSCSSIPRALVPGCRENIYVLAPEVDMLNLDNVAKERLDQGHAVTLNGQLTIRDDLLVLSKIPISFDLVQSRASLESDKLDLGMIGYTSNFESKAFSFVIVNESDVALDVVLSLPDAVRLASRQQATLKRIRRSPTPINTTLGHARYKIAPRKTQEVSCLLDPTKLEKDEKSVIIVNNVNNPTNTLVVELQYELTAQQISFERLEKVGEQNLLTLPPITYPAIEGAVAGDNWFVVANESDQDASFDTIVEFEPEIDGLIQVEVVSRSSNSPLVGTTTLPAKGSLEVRVRATAADGRTNRTDLFSDFSLGHLVVRHVKDDAVLSLERILLTSKLTESSAFSLSASQVTFRCVDVSDGEEVDEIEKKPKRRRRSSILSQVSDQLASRDAKLAWVRQHVQHKETIVLSNLMRESPLTLQVQIQLPVEIPTTQSLIKLDMEGDLLHILPGQRFLLGVELTDPTFHAISDDIRIKFTDVDSPNRLTQTLSVRLVEDNESSMWLKKSTENLLASTKLERMEEFEDDVSLPTMDTQDDDLDALSVMSNASDTPSQIRYPHPHLLEARRDTMDSIGTHSSHVSEDPDLKSPLEPHQSPDAILHVRGCRRALDPRDGTEIQGLYELDLGQQDLGAPSITRKLVLLNKSPEPISWRLRTVWSLDSSWISFSRTIGTVEGILSSTSTESSVNLYFTPLARGMYQTYVVVENINNGADTKVVRITMEVVSTNKQAEVQEPESAIVSKSLGIYEVYCNGQELGDKDAVLEMDNLFYNHTYGARSFVIVNRDASPLEFAMTHNVRQSDPFELLFSLSRTSTKLFGYLTVPPEGQQRVYLRAFSDISEEGDVVYPRADPHPNNVTHARELEAYVSCRMVRDHQKVIRVKLWIQKPCLTLNTQELLFVGQGSNFECQDSTIVISNISKEPVEYEILNDSLFFDVMMDGEKTSRRWRRSSNRAYQGHGIGSVSLDAGSSKAVTIVPRAEALVKYAQLLARHRYVVDQLVVYNRNRPWERLWITVRISLGHLNSFWNASVLKEHYLIVEGQIIGFLRDALVHELTWSTNWDENTSRDLQVRLARLVDQLIFFGTREHAGDTALLLANLLFPPLYRHGIFSRYAPADLMRYCKLDEIIPERVWPKNLVDWIAPLGYFLSFFPLNTPLTKPLRDIYQHLVGKK